MITKLNREKNSTILLQVHGKMKEIKETKRNDGQQEKI